MIVVCLCHVFSEKDFKIFNTIITSLTDFPLAISSKIDEYAPKDYICPVSWFVMVDPVLTVDGHTYEREAIENWFKSSKITSPLTNCELRKGGLVDTSITPNMALRKAIEEWTQKQLYKKVSKPLILQKSLSVLCIDAYEEPHA
jgi:hypothetical protein